jgi:hypothetical protein
MNSIAQRYEEEQGLSETFLRFSKKFEIGKALKQSNINKEKGVGTLHVFMSLLKVAFTGKSFNRLVNKGEIGIKKDVAYRFLNSARANWSVFLAIVSLKLIEFVMPLTSEERINTLILDDTVFKRNRRKKVELLTKVQDHADMKYYRGLRCLTLGWSDGNTFVPVGYQLLSSSNEKTRINGINESIDKRTNGYKRRTKSLIGAYKASYDLIGAAKAPATHVLFDSWFSAPAMFMKLNEFGYHGIGMLKANRWKEYTTTNGSFCTLEELYSIVSSKIPKDKDFVSIIVTRGKETNLEMKLVFVRHPHGKRDWLAIGTTDLGLNDEKILELYARRWDIEMFFKTVKSYLRFAKEFQSISFDALTAEVAIVFTRYLMLASEARRSADKRSAGDLFFLVYDEMRDYSLAQALNLIFQLLLSTFKLFIPSSEIEAAVSFFISLLPYNLLAFLPINNCET